MRRKLLYIASMPHSGSTLIGLLLGTHPAMVGLGEFDRSVAALADDPERHLALPCTCGAAASDCPYWSEVARRLRGGPQRNQIDRYRLALDVFKEIFGADVWAVDSSKNFEGLRSLHASGDFDLRAIHLLKDVRALAISFIENRRRAKGGARLGAIIAIEYFWKWHRRNGKIARILADTPDLASERISYEQLCLEPDAVMRRIGALLAIAPTPLSMELRDSRSHIFLGNRMRRDAGSQRLRYDYRWFYRNEWLPAAFLFPHIMRANAAMLKPE